MPLAPDIRAFYTAPAAMTAIPQTQGADATAGVAPVFAQVQGVMLHQHLAGAYGQTLSAERIAQSHLRSARDILGWLAATGGGAPALAPRGPEDRVIGVCRHFSTLAAALLRRQGTPARERCGFGLYFDATPVDHWVVEYWDEAAGAWRLGDAQLDATQRAALNIAFDPLDAPRDQFLIAGEAWRRCRAGLADPERFGIFDMHGLWFVAGNLVRDLAALNNMAMLPWDVWGTMFQPGQAPTAAALAKLDRVAALTLDPDAHFAELRSLYETDADLRIPDRVLNALTGRMEAASPAIETV